MLTIDEIVEKAKNLKVSDIHIVCGLPVKGRIDGRMRSISEEVLTKEDCEIIAKDLAGDLYNNIKSMGELDFARSFPCGARTRINLFRQQNTVSAAIRILSSKIPRISDLKLPPVINTLSSYRNGIILVTGETGSGKSTTLAAVLDEINHSREGHIITLEDPVEYVYTPDKCVINQREIGKDTASYADGLKAILREDPDVILIGEMRDINTIEAAITAAETGHLVFSTLHTNSAADSIDRIVNVFPNGLQEQVRMQLSTTLRVVLAQQLLPQKIGGRVAACEIMVVNDAIKNLIREGKTPQIESFITMNSEGGSITMDNAIKKLLLERKISDETAYAFARNKDEFKKVF